MSNPAKIDRKANLISGAIFLVLIALISGYLIINKLINIPAEPPRVYVAYFENSGGLREGDRVRIQGRAAGKVNSVEVVNHNGKVVTRVEFEVTPGTGSTWLTEMERAGGIPSDSTIGVKMPSFLGRPILVITIGKDDANPIGEGGEWLNTKSANQSDQVTQWGEDIERARVGIRSFLDFFEDREQFERLNKNLTDIADALEKADRAMAKLEGRGADVDKALDQMRTGMDDVRESLNGKGEAVAKDLPKFAEQTAETAEKFDAIADDLTRAMEEVERINTSLDGAVSNMEKSKLDEIGLELRRLSARLRAGLEIAEKNPKQFGDMPNWRRSRPYFQGGTPASGTSIDDPPPAAPSEKIGVPTGPAGPKREK
jgi:ABC-type transporter Mla subunit MlaD